MKCSIFSSIVNVKPEKTSKMESSPFDNVTTSRAAGVIQLEHKKDPTFEVNHTLQARMDEKIHEYIRETY